MDKFISCLGKLNPDRFELSSPEVYKGAFFITTHVGNVEILRSLFQSDKYPNPQRVNVFLQSNACEIFNNFLKTLEIKLSCRTNKSAGFNSYIRTSEKWRNCFYGRR